MACNSFVNVVLPARWRAMCCILRWVVVVAAAAVVVVEEDVEGVVEVLHVVNFAVVTFAVVNVAYALTFLLLQQYRANNGSRDPVFIACFCQGA